MNYNDNPTWCFIAILYNDDKNTQVVFFKICSTLKFVLKINFLNSGEEEIVGIFNVSFV